MGPLAGRYREVGKRPKAQRLELLGPEQPSRARDYPQELFEGRRVSCGRLSDVLPDLDSGGKDLLRSKHLGRRYGNDDVRRIAQ